MTTDRSYLAGGLRNIHEDLIASEEPISAALLGLLTHNQQLITNHLVPRHLVNQWFPKDGSSQALTDPEELGQRVGIWGPFSALPSMELRVKIFGTKITATYSSNTELYLFSSPTFPDQDDLLEELLENSAEYWTSTIENTSGRWIDGSMVPNPGEGAEFYLSLRSYPTDDAASEADLGGVCIRERIR